MKIISNNLLILLLLAKSYSVYAIDPPYRSMSQPIEVDPQFLMQFCLTFKASLAEDDFIHFELVVEDQAKNCVEFSEIEELHFSLRKVDDSKDVVILESIYPALREGVTVEKYFSKGYAGRIGFKIKKDRNSHLSDRFYVEINPYDRTPE